MHRELPRRPRNGGFTLIELLVVIAIISVLVALLLPAVQGAREASRRLECVNNLMQIGLAIKGYEATYEVLPAGVIDPSAGPLASTPKGQHTSWIVQILPYIEQKSAFRQYNFPAGAYGAENSTISQYRIRTLICPSDPMAFSTVASSYAGCDHDAEGPIASTNHGVFVLNRHIRYEEVEDGASNTIYVGEKLIEAGDLGWLSGTRATLRNTGSTRMAPAKPLLPVTPSPSGGPATPEPVPAQPAPGSPAPAATGPESPSFVGSFSGRHPGGFNAGFGDGSVRFIKSTINPRIFQLLGNRADGELLSSDKY